MPITLDGTLGITSVTGQAATAVAGPAFSAYASTTQTVTNSTFTKVTFDTEQFDTNNNFASSTFTPTVAGYYQVNFLLTNVSAASTITRIIGSLYKNGVSIGRDFDITMPATVNPAAGSGARVVYMNGTTDYLEVYGFITGSGTLNISGTVTTNTSYFSACLIRGA